MIAIVFQTVAALWLQQLSVNVDACIHSWLSEDEFLQLTEMELASTPQGESEVSLSIVVSCTERHAEVIVTNTEQVENGDPPLRQVVSIWKTPEETRERMLAMVVADLWREHQLHPQMRMAHQLR